MTRRIAILAPSFLPIPASRGGAIETLATYFVEENEKTGGFEIDIYCQYDADAKKLADGYHHARCLFMRPAGGLNRLWNKAAFAVRMLTHERVMLTVSYIAAVDRELAKHSYDAVLVEGAPEMMLKLGRKYPNTILHVHTDILNAGFGYYQKVMSCAPHIVAVSSFVAGKINSAVPDQVSVIRNCVDSRLFHPDGRNEALRESLGIREDDFLIIFAARVDHTKGIDHLVNAVLQLNNPHIRLLVIGAGWFSADRRTAFEEMLSRKTASHQDQFLFTGYIDHGKIPEYLHAADLGAAPSVCYDAAPLSVIEMQACGLEVIASNIGGIPEYINDPASLIDPHGEDFERELAGKIADRYAHRTDKPAYRPQRTEKIYYQELASYTERVIEEAGDGKR